MVQIDDPDVRLLAYAILGNLDDGSQVSFGDCLRSFIWMELPEVVLDRILMFLPEKSICRLRVVCKRWRHLLTSADFFKSKELLAPLPLLICSFDDGDWNGDASPLHCVPVNPPTKYWFRYFVTKKFLDSVPLENEAYKCWSIVRDTNCGDGLVCLERRCGSRYLVVANPGTSTSRLLPRIPDFHFEGLSRGRICLRIDEAHGTTFTLSWHSQLNDMDNHGVYRVYWAVGVYSSASDRWTTCQEFVTIPTDRDIEATGLVYDGRLFVVQPAGDGSDDYCAWYSFHTGKFVSLGKATFPQMGVSPMHSLQEEVAYFGAHWGIVEHFGTVYVVASILGTPSNRTHGFGIWKLHLDLFKFERVAVTTVELIEQLCFLRSDAVLSNVCVVGDFICLEIAAESKRDWTGGHGLNHVIAFHVVQQFWHVVYVETDDDARLMLLPEGPAARTVLSTFPLMRPNYYFRP